MGQQQQTVLRVQTNSTDIPTYEFLDLYSSIPIKVNKVFADLEDIGSRNTDYTLNVQLPGSKKNNRFFESFFNVDTQTLYFNPTQKIPCNVLINDESYFNGFLRLNKISVLNSKVEYDVSLYSVVADIFGDIGNKLLNELPFNDTEYTFNHFFNLTNVASGYNTSIFGKNQEAPNTYYYPIVHNGYLYSGDSVNFTGGTLDEKTNLYTSTKPLGSYDSLASFTGSPNNGKLYRINTPSQGLYDNQLKPAISVWNLIKLMFKTYGYSIKSDFFNTPWFKALYIYGYFSASDTKFAYTIQSIQSFPYAGVQVYFYNFLTGPNIGQVWAIPVINGTGIPCYCSQDIPFSVLLRNPVDGTFDTINSTIKANTAYKSVNKGGRLFVNATSSVVSKSSSLRYLPKKVGDSVIYRDGDYVDFSTVIDSKIKQIDFLSSIAKKFNLIFYSNPDNPKEIIIEPFSYFVGTGDVYDWTDKISYDQGFTVEPALNKIDSNIIISDLEDGDYGNEQFKSRNNRVYGAMYYYGPTTYKSQEKTIETIFSPEVFRIWDTVDQVNNAEINLPLGINYAASSNSSESNNGNTVKQNFTYTGLKSKPKLIYNLGSGNLIFNTVGQHYDNSKEFKSYNIYLTDSLSGTTYNSYPNTIVTSDTIPIGMQDQYKINNDTLSILFNSELTSIIPPQTFNTYTINDSYELFYKNRIDNLYNSSTRFLTGKFYLKLNEYKQLTPKDLIKINNQYFIWNSVKDYNLTDVELTEVELVQINNNPNTYPTRYFKYTYCDQTGTTFCFKTDFTNPNLLDTNFGFSVMYDRNCGIMYGTAQPTGYTSSFMYVTGTTNNYVPYTIQEITQSECENSGYCDWTGDPLRNYIWSLTNGPYGYNTPTLWYSISGTNVGINLFYSCSDFNTKASTYNIQVGSSTHFGTPTCGGKNITTEVPEPILTENNDNIQTG